MSRSLQDALAILRGVQLVVEAAYKEQKQLSKHLWANSSVRELFEDNLQLSANYFQQTTQDPQKELKRLKNLLVETAERSCVVAEGIRQLINVKITQEAEYQMSHSPQPGSATNSTGGFGGGSITSTDGARNISNITDTSNLDVSSITLKELEEILSKRNKDREVNLRLADTKSKQLKKEDEKNDISTLSKSQEDVGQVKEQIANTPPASIPSIEPKLSKQFNSPSTLKQDTVYVENILKLVTSGAPTPPSSSSNDLASSSPAPSSDLISLAKQRKVPSSRLGRLASFGELFAGLGVGTLNELTKGALGLGGATNMKEALFSPANVERIVDTLCKVRGAALKIGQILSIQDSKVVSPELAKAFERVRQAADYMPDWQVERVMTSELGSEWRELLKTFDDKPFAAASIGQVHRATLKNDMPVAIKIQYPGVAQSIESDIDNLIGMLKVWNVFPHGFFVDNVVKVAKRELNWEVDYKREAEYTEKFKEMIAPYPVYYVPNVIKELTTSNVITTELVPGVPLDKCFEISYDHRQHIGESVLKLCLRELFELQCMQTDPNWSNFLYDINSKRLMLIDFGSTRFYPNEFIKNYRHVIMCAVNNNRLGVLEMSREMGFLTGYESKQMENAHVDAVMILGEIFRYDGYFDFGRQSTTERIAHLVPTMVAHRLCPPPEEIYSIHRKLSGIFLLCSRLNIKLNCRPYYEEIVLGKFKE